MPRQMRQQAPPGPPPRDRQIYGMNPGDVLQRHAIDTEQARYNWTYGDAGERLSAIPQLVGEATGLSSLRYLPHALRAGDTESALVEGGTAAATLLPEVAGARGLFGAGRARAPRVPPRITEPPPAPIRPPPREIGANGLPVRPPEPFRNSMRGGSEDLREAARPRTQQPRPDGGTALDETALRALRGFLREDGLELPASMPRLPETEVPVNALRENQIGSLDRADARRYANMTTQAPPILVRNLGNGKFEVIDGNRRAAAARIRGDENIRVVDATSLFEPPPAASSAAAGPQRTFQHTPSRNGAAGRIALPDGNGSISYVDNGDGSWSVREVAVDPAVRGTKRGIALYEELARQAQQAGVRTLLSDGVVSRDAQHVWSALSRRGYPVEFNGGHTYTLPLTKPPSEPLASTAGFIPIPRVVQNDLRRLGSAIQRRFESPLSISDGMGGGGGGGEGPTRMPDDFRDSVTSNEFPMPFGARKFGGEDMRHPESELRATGNDSSTKPWPPRRRPMREVPQEQWRDVYHGTGAQFDEFQIPPDRIGYKHAARLSAHDPARTNAFMLPAVPVVGATTAFALGPQLRRKEEEQFARNRALARMRQMNDELRLGVSAYKNGTQQNAPNRGPGR